MKIVSIITPLYHGEQYIPRLIQMAEACQKVLGDSISLELVLSNDDPEGSIEEDTYSDTISVILLDTKINRGIQGARVQGLKRSSGEYIVFLDQDDIMYPDYVKSQLSCIGDADAVVCRCIHENKQFYNVDRKFEDVVSEEHMLTKGNPIISAGQVLLRRESIPELWIDNIMETNCADDYLLWLCMLAGKAEFALNQNILFEHTVNGSNLSLDYKRMILSLDEMYDILSENKAFDDEKLRKISNMRRNAMFDWIALLEKFRDMFMTLNMIAICREKGCPFGKRLKDKGVQRVAIYGAGYLGKRLVGELAEYNIETIFFIDRNADYLKEEVPVYKLEDAPDNIDMVIISLVRNYNPVKSLLREKYNVGIYTIREIIERSLGDE
ncbi:MAG: glycosyltransferase family 2 protein [Butyrivibrio sp.]|nr:glycosyltransferase family 2 protein [Butyrivibrio sp.]